MVNKAADCLPRLSPPASSPAIMPEEVGIQVIDQLMIAVTPYTLLKLRVQQENFRLRLHFLHLCAQPNSERLCQSKPKNFRIYPIREVA